MLITDTYTHEKKMYTIKSYTPLRHRYALGTTHVYTWSTTHKQRGRDRQVTQSDNMFAFIYEICTCAHAPNVRRRCKDVHVIYIFIHWLFAGRTQLRLCNNSKSEYYITYSIQTRIHTILYIYICVCGQT